MKRSLIHRTTQELSGTVAGHRRTLSMAGGAARSGRRTLTVDEAARALGISRSTAYECVRNGSLPALRFRRRIVISAVVIEQLLGISDLTPDDSRRAPRAG